MTNRDMDKRERQTNKEMVGDETRNWMPWWEIEIDVVSSFFNHALKFSDGGPKKYAKQP
jgi:hypothetical protein